MATAQNITSPLDSTGRAADKARKDNAKALAEAQERMSVAQAAEAQSLANDVFDPLVQAPIVIDEIENVGVTLADDSVIIRTVVDIEEMTYGVGNTYTFKAGQKYKVPKKIADYLEALGYIWRA